jgi:hypothetical protein
MNPGRTIYAMKSANGNAAGHSKRTSEEDDNARLV